MSITAFTIDINDVAFEIRPPDTSMPLFSLNLVTGEATSVWLPSDWMKVVSDRALILFNAVDEEERKKGALTFLQRFINASPLDDSVLGLTAANAGNVYTLSVAIADGTGPAHVAVNLPYGTGIPGVSTGSTLAVVGGITTAGTGAVIMNGSVIGYSNANTIAPGAITNAMITAGAGIEQSKIADLVSDLATINATLATKANDNTVVKLTGAQTIAGVKTFTAAPVVPANSFPESAVIDLVDDLAAINAALATKADASTVVTLTSTQSISGLKSFTAAQTNFKGALGLWDGTAYDYGTAGQFPVSAGTGAPPEWRLLDAADIPSLSAIYLPLAGGSMTGKLTLPAATTASAYLNIGNGASPTSPVDGDIWASTASLRVRIQGVSQTIPATGSNNTFTSSSSTYGNSTATGTIGLAIGATVSGATKTVNIGTGGVSGSTTAVNIGSSFGTTSATTINGTVVLDILRAATNSTFYLSPTTGSVTNLVNILPVPVSVGATPTALRIYSGSTSAAGGTSAVLTLGGGDATGVTGTGGAVTIIGGSGPTANGAISIGTTTTSSVTIGATNTPTTVTGTLNVNAIKTRTGTDLSIDPSSGNLLRIAPTTVATSPVYMTITGGSASGASAGGTLALAGGNAGTGNADGGGISLSGGVGVGTGVRGTATIIGSTVTVQTDFLRLNPLTSSSFTVQPDSVATGIPLTIYAGNSSAATIAGANLQLRGGRGGINSVSGSVSVEAGDKNATGGTRGQVYLGTLSDTTVNIGNSSGITLINSYQVALTNGLLTLARAYGAAATPQILVSNNTDSANSSLWIQAGDSASTSAGSLFLYGGDTITAGRSGGGVTIRGGTAGAGGTTGSVTIGADSTSAISIGAAAITTTFAGTVSIPSGAGGAGKLIAGVAIRKANSALSFSSGTYTEVTGTSITLPSTKSYLASIYVGASTLFTGGTAIFTLMLNGVAQADIITSASSFGVALTEITARTTVSIAVKTTTTSGTLLAGAVQLVVVQSTTTA